MEKKHLKVGLKKFPTVKSKSYQPAAWSTEDKTTLGKDIWEQLPDNLDASTEVHFSPISEGNPYETDISTLKTRATTLRSELLAKSIVMILENKTLKEKLIANGKRSAVDFCKERMATETLKIYQSI